MSDLLPGLVQVEEQHAKIKADYAQFVRQADQQPQQLARDREKGRLLLERLRYQQYVRHGTLGVWFHTIGEGVRRRQGPWYWLFLGLMVWGYLGFAGWVL